MSLTARPFRPYPTLSAQHGTTLIELLVAMLTGTIVLFALLAILEFSTNQDARISDRVQANRTGRVAMAKVIDELHSACTGFGETAIQGPSETPVSPLASTGATDLWFISDYSNQNAGTAFDSEPIEHDIHWAATGLKSPTGQALGTITDYRFTHTGGEPEKWQFQTLTAEHEKAAAHVLATNVIAPTLPATATLFHYYKFETKTSIKLLELGSSEIVAAAKAAEIAKVSVNFTQGPEGTDTKPSSAVSLSDSVLLRFNPSETGTEAQNVPCA
jgi:hypothetical protein